MIIAAGLMFFCFTPAIAADRQQPASASLTAHAPEMSTAGKVTAISDTVLKIERTLKGKVETMEFVLEKPFASVAVGDELKVSYTEKNGQNVLLRVAPAKKTAVQKMKKDNLRTAKPVESSGSPAKK